MSDRLTPGQHLSRGDRIASPSGAYYAVLQEDGNFVLYRWDSGLNTSLWATNSQGSDCNKVAMQEDGNLVLYHVNNEPAWASNTFGRGIFLAMQDDGNLVLYQPEYPVWATGTNE